MAAKHQPQRNLPEPTNSRERSSRNWHRALLALMVLFGFAVSGTGGVVAYFLPTVTAAVKITGQATAGRGYKSVKVKSVTTPPPPGQPFTVLLLGSDNDTKFPTSAVLTQTMVLVRVDPPAHSVVMVSIPRDLWVPIASGGSEKIDTAYEQGLSKDAVETVERDFKVPVNYWAWIGLNGLVDLVNQIGGVDVVAEMPVLDVQYPDDLSGHNPYANQRIAILPGPQRLDGVNALTYVRSRHGALLEDIARNQKQQELLVDIKDAAKHINLTEIPQIASVLGNELRTDMSLTEIGSIGRLAKDFSNGDVKEIVMLPPDYTSGWEMVNGSAEDVLLPNWNAINVLVTQNFPS